MRTIVVFCGIALGLVLGLVSVNWAGADPPPKGDADKVKALLKERQQTLEEELKLVLQREDIVPDKSIWLEQALHAMEALVDVDLELSASPAERLAAYKKGVESLQKMEKNFKDRVNQGFAVPQDYARARETRLKVEIKMTKEQMKQNAK
ncbi:MAG TPA: hypothetical protein VGZ47_01570 [Gemmataceae bacterium]|jgi:hypothetical protein|nr:hypothetical protein [Gemmataceae bacterium]